VLASTLVTLALVLLGYAAISRRVQGTIVTAPIVFVAAGFLASDACFGVLDFHADNHAVSLLAEATLAVVLFTDASRIDLRALRRESAVPMRLLGIGLPLTIVAGLIAGVVVLPSLLVVEALVLAIVLAPTDAALGQAVVTDARLPSRIRQGLNVESGLNDGLCVPLLAIALAVAQADVDALTASAAARVVVEAIGWGVAGGLVGGGIAAAVLRYARARGWIEPHWAQIVPVAGAALSYGLADSRGGSGFIAAFVGGVVFGLLTEDDAAEAKFAEEVGGVLSGATLFLFGAAMLGERWGHIGAAEVGYAVASLTIVRMIPVAIAMWGMHAKRPTVLLLGWFGPRGLASIVFGVVVVETADLPHTGTMVDTITATVALSVVAHGVSAAPLVRRYVAWHDASRPAMESRPVPEQRWRHRPPDAVR